MLPPIIERNAVRILVAIVFVLLIAGFMTLRSCQAERGAKTQAKVSTGQAGAALQSGQDAANTVGNRMDADAGEDQLTRTNGDEIRKADGASAPVASPVRDAGLRSLCKRAAYRGNPKCVQFADPR